MTTPLWRNRFLALALSGMLGLSLAGCATHDPAPLIVKTPETHMIELVEEASATLLANTRGISPDKPIIAATFVDIDDLQRSSTLGRTLSELFTSGLVQAGLTVIEVKMRNSLFIEQNTGELMLSRDVQRLSLAHDAQAVLIGTYAQAERSAYVNVRIVRARDNVILGATSIRLPLDRDIRALLPTAW
ncbi:FlgO family outer membrane protein [Modicisalibacter xianhensis]|uniref:TolB amino-terminal domain-containing protein n=1 Tax=Modicisalibacter xianhensis TaxID=442341 RepID=A0A1I3A3X5_9GAMM|nr:FlgO family outer membrane protein [Halomonas xianhensis]SFH44807.1 TolB amino-terminal domain-containing protein [Halomonas xianhensis]